MSSTSTALLRNLGTPLTTVSLAVVALVVAILASSIVWAAEEEVNNGQDPTRPLTRFDFRYQYQNLPPDDHDNSHISTLRADKPFVLSQRWTLAARSDLPLFLRRARSRWGAGSIAWSRRAPSGSPSPR